MRECVDLVNRVENRSIDEIFGYPDTMKFQSSLTLFAEAATDNEVFKRALDEYFAGAIDQNTLRLLGKRRAESD